MKKKGKTMSVTVPNRAPSPAEFLNQAGIIDRLVVSLHRKRYYEDVRDTIIRSMYDLSSAMISALVRANDLYAVEQNNAGANRLITLPMIQERFQLFNEAKGYLAALSQKATELYIVKPVKHRYRGTKKDLAVALQKEYKLLKGLCDTERDRLRKYAKEADGVPEE